MEKTIITRISEEILYKYNWLYRNGRDDVETMPQKLKQTILQQLKDNVAEYQGVTPYFTLANVKGIYNRVLTEDEDGVVFVVAPPGYGKTTVSLILAKFIDPTLHNDPARIIFTMEELKAFLRLCANELKKEKSSTLNGRIYRSKLKGKAVVLDEGVYMMFSGDATSKDGKMVQKLFSVIRALNLMFFVNVTNFRKVNRGVKEDRIIGLIKVIKRGTISFWSKKRIKKIKINNEDIYWARPNYTEFIGKLDKESQYWKEYENKKAMFLYSSVEEETKKKPGREKKTKTTLIKENE